MRRANHRKIAYSPLRDKTLHNMLRHLFVTEFGYESKTLFADAMIDRILATIDAFVQPLSLVKPGQLVWMAVQDDGHKHARAQMKDIPQIPVVLDLITDGDLESLEKGVAYPQVRRQRQTRLLRQTFAQGGVLALADVAAMTLIAPSNVARTVKQTQRQEHCILPHRGSIQDVGGTISHKVEVIRLYEEGHLEPDICRLLSPTHSLEAVERYVQAYKNVLKLLDHGFTRIEISAILTMPMRLVVTYEEIATMHHPNLQQPSTLADHSQRHPSDKKRENIPTPSGRSPVSPTACTMQQQPTDVNRTRLPVSDCSTQKAGVT